MELGIHHPAILNQKRSGAFRPIWRKKMATFLSLLGFIFVIAVPVVSIGVLIYYAYQLINDVINVWN
jgi:hypothetical protein